MFTATVKVSFKGKEAVIDEFGNAVLDDDGQPKMKDKKFQAKKPCQFVENTGEAAKIHGEAGATTLINEAIKQRFADNLRAKLKAHVTGEDNGASADIEDMSDLLDD